MKLAAYTNNTEAAGLRWLSRLPSSTKPPMAQSTWRPRSQYPQKYSGTATAMPATAAALSHGEDGNTKGSTRTHGM